MNQKYHPINCHFHDELELLAIRQQVIPIFYFDESKEELQIMDTIVDFKIIEQAEFLILKSDLKIRLDRLISVDGKILEGFCGL